LSNPVIISIKDSQADDKTMEQNNLWQEYLLEVHIYKELDVLDPDRSDRIGRSS